MSATRAIGLLFLFALAIPCASYADGLTAKDHYKKGLSYYALQKYAEAAVEYEAAFELEPDPALLFNAAQAHRLAGNKQRALALYESFLRLFPQKEDGSVMRHIVALRAAIAAESKAEPPMTTRASEEKREAKPAADVAPQQGQTVQITAQPSPPPEHKRKPKWLWGVVAGAVVVVGVGLSVGLGVGLSGNQYPTPTVGSARLQ